MPYTPQRIKIHWYSSQGETLIIFLSLITTSSRTTVFLIAIIAGMSDCCLCSVRSVICALAMPKRRAQAFSVSKIYQSIGSCVIFFLSPTLSIYHYTLGIPILCIFACFFFFREAGRTQTMERKLTEELEEVEKRRIAKQLEADMQRIWPFIVKFRPFCIFFNENLWKPWKPDQNSNKNALFKPKYASPEKHQISADSLDVCWLTFLLFSKKELYVPI